VGWHSEEMITLPAWAPGEGSIALIEHVHDESSTLERFSSRETEEEQRPCWWLLSALDSIDGKEAREAYYSKL
jgi:hypothetical protein